MKRILSLALMLSLLLSLVACVTTGGETPTMDIPQAMETSVAAPEPTPAFVSTGDAELDRALQLGIGTHSELDRAVTYAQFMAMLNRVVELADSTKLAGWQGQLAGARRNTSKITRMNAAFAIYAAAEYLGGEYGRSDNSWGLLPGQTDDIGDMGETSAFFGDPNGETIINTPFGPFTYPWDKLHQVYAFSFLKTSAVSGKSILEYDPDKRSLRPKDALTYAEALLAALRLYESAPEVTERIMTAGETALLEKAEAHKQSIINSPTTVMVTGRKYYVSNNGNDSNNGLSPATAWKTVTKVSQMGYKGKLKYGDGVFFERGGLWREQLYAVSGITYSAYGEGDKPRLYGSPENGASPEKWTLWYDEGGKKIWKFHNEIQNCGGIVFNEGESYASRVYSHYDGTNHVIIDSSNFAQCKRKPFVISEQLQHDLQFYTTFSDMRIYDASGWPEGALSADIRGEIYLRCDKGNPGELYNSIEFQARNIQSSGAARLIDGGSWWEYKGDYIYETWGSNSPNAQGMRDVVIDNLCLKYADVNAIYCNINTTIQNCEIGWIGGGLLINGEMKVDEYLDGPGNGECILFCGDNSTGNTAVNNYIYQVGNAAITIEGGIDPEGGGIATGFHLSAVGNYIERCAVALFVYDWYPFEGNEPPFGDITFEDNYAMYSGYGFSTDPHTNFFPETLCNEVYPALGHAFGNIAHDSYDKSSYANGGIYVRNNVFYISTGALVEFASQGEYAPKFDGNTYVQNDGGIVALTRNELGFTRAYMMPVYATSEENMREAVLNRIGDKTGIIFAPTK